MHACHSKQASPAWKCDDRGLLSYAILAGRRDRSENTRGVGGALRSRARVIAAFLKGLTAAASHSIAVGQSGRQDVLRVASKSWQEEDARSRWLMTMCFGELIID